MGLSRSLILEAEEGKINLTTIGSVLREEDMDNIFGTEKMMELIEEFSHKVDHELELKFLFEGMDLTTRNFNLFVYISCFLEAVEFPQGFWKSSKDANQLPNAIIDKLNSLLTIVKAKKNTPGEMGVVPFLLMLAGFNISVNFFASCSLITNQLASGAKQSTAPPGLILVGSL